MTAEIIAIGSELLTPYRQDTNSLMLTDRLNRLGMEVRRKVILGDDRANLAAALRCAPGDSAIGRARFKQVLSAFGMSN